MKLYALFQGCMITLDMTVLSVASHNSSMFLCSLQGSCHAFRVDLANYCAVKGVMCGC